MAINLNVSGNTQPLEAAVQAAVNRIRRQPIKITVDDKGATQPLGNMKRSADEFSKSMEAANARIIAFGASMAIINGIADAFKAVARNAIEVEKAMADINVVMNLSAQNLDKFSDGLFNVAKETGAAFNVAAQAATEYARQGLSVEQSLKRTRDALILTRLTGMDSAEAVKALTAAMNTYGNQIKDTTQLVSKFAAVDVQFAVSAEDFADAIARTGQAAKSAGVSIDELIGLVTAAQQQTARGGKVIGNSFKTIFTRIGRTDTLNQLENLGIAVRDLEGNTLGAKRILTDLANSFDGLSAAQQAQIAQTVGGVFQINILKAVLSDAAKQNGILANATQISSSATNEAIQKNEQLRGTMSAMATETGLALKDVSAQIGEIMLAPGMEKILNTVKSIAEGASAMLGDGESAGGKFANGFLKGLGNIITGPGLVVLTVVFGKLFLKAAQFAKESLTSLIGVTSEAQKQKAIQTSLVNLFGQNSALSKEMLRTDISRTEKEKIILSLLQAQVVEAQMLDSIAKRTASTLYSRGYGASLTPRRGRATGHIPNFAHPERAQAAKGGYAAGNIRSMNMPGEGSVIYNSAEKVKNFAGFTQPAIMPPLSSKAGKNYQQAFGSVHGFDPYAGSGYIPNFNRKYGQGMGKAAPVLNAINYAHMLTPEAGTRDVLEKPANPVYGVPKAQLPKVRFKKFGVLPSASTRAENKKKNLVEQLHEAVEKSAVRQGQLLADSFKIGTGKASSKTIKNLLNSPESGGAGALSSVVGALFEAAISTKIKQIKGQSGGIAGVATGIGGDFDLRNPTSEQKEDLKILFGGSWARTNLADYKSQDSIGNAQSMAEKILKEKIFRSGGRSTDPALAFAYGKKAGVDPRTQKRGLFARGYIPNFADPLSDAIGREKAAGVPVSQIRVGSHNALMSRGNPLGLGVTNTKDEPNGLRDVFGANGYVPNYAFRDGVSRTISSLLDKWKSTTSAVLSISQRKVVNEMNALQGQSKFSAREAAEHLKIEGFTKRETKEAMLQLGYSKQETAQSLIRAHGSAMQNVRSTASGFKGKLEQGRLGKFGKGLMGGPGMGLMIGGSMLAGSLMDDPKNKTAYGAGGALQGASVGLSMGMMFGPIGAAVGALGGAAYGLISSLSDSEKAIKEEAEARRKMLSELNKENFAQFVNSQEISAKTSAALPNLRKSFLAAGMGENEKISQTFADAAKTAQINRAIQFKDPNANKLLLERIRENLRGESSSGLTSADRRKSRLDKLRDEALATGKITQEEYNKVAFLARDGKRRQNLNLTGNAGEILSILNKAGGVRYSGTAGASLKNDLKLQNPELAKGAFVKGNAQNPFNIARAQFERNAKAGFADKVKNDIIDYLFKDDPANEKYEYKGLDPEGKEFNLKDLSKQDMKALFKGEEITKGGKVYSADKTQVENDLTKYMQDLESESAALLEEKKRAIIVRLSMEKAMIASQKASKLAQIKIAETYGKIAQNLNMQLSLGGDNLTNIQKAEIRYQQALNKAAETREQADEQIRQQAAQSMLQEIEENTDVKDALKRFLLSQKLVANNATNVDLSSAVGNMTQDQLERSLFMMGDKTKLGAADSIVFNLMEGILEKRKAGLEINEKQEASSNRVAKNERDSNKYLNERNDLLDKIKRKNIEISRQLDYQQKINQFDAQKRRAVSSLAQTQMYLDPVQKNNMDEQLRIAEANDKISAVKVKHQKEYNSLLERNRKNLEDEKRFNELDAKKKNEAVKLTKEEEGQLKTLTDTGEIRREQIKSYNKELKMLNNERRLELSTIKEVLGIENERNKILAERARIQQALETASGLANFYVDMNAAGRNRQMEIQKSRRLTAFGPGVKSSAEQLAFDMNEMDKDSSKVIAGLEDEKIKAEINFATQIGVATASKNIPLVEALNNQKKVTLDHLDQEINKTKILNDEAKKRVQNEYLHSRSFSGGLADGFQQVRNQTDAIDHQLGEQLPLKLRDGLAEAMQAGINGAEDMGDVLRNIGINFLQAIQSAMLQKAAGNIVGAMGFSRGGQVPAMVSNGEYVMSRSAVKKYGGGFMHSLNAGGKIPGYSNGGKPGSALAANFGGAEGYATGRRYQSEAMSGFFYSGQAGNVGLQEDAQYTRGIIQERMRKAAEKKAKKQALKKMLLSTALSAGLSAGVENIFKGGSLTKAAKEMGYTSDTPRGAMYDPATNTTILDGGRPGENLIPLRENSFKNLNPFRWIRNLKKNYFGGPISKYASGGYISGKPGVDQIPAMLSEGEYVIRASSARQLGKPLLDSINLGKFNQGGAVTPLKEQSESTTSSGNTNNINISINVDRSGGQSKDSSGQNSGQNPKDASENQSRENQLAEKVKAQVVAVIIEEQRPGGLLSE